MALGLKYGESEIEDLVGRKKAKDVAVKMLERFKSENGSYICRDLLGYDRSNQEDMKIIIETELFTKFCPKMVESATRIVGELMNEEDTF